MKVRFAAAAKRCRTGHPIEMDQQSKPPASHGEDSGGSAKPPAKSTLSAIGRIQVMIDAAERSATEIAESAALLAKRASEIRIESEELISSLEETKADIQQQLSPAPAEASRQGRLLASAAQAESEAVEAAEENGLSAGARLLATQMSVAGSSGTRSRTGSATSSTSRSPNRCSMRFSARARRPASRLEAAEAGLRSHFRAERRWPWIAGLRGPEEIDERAAENAALGR